MAAPRVLLLDLPPLLRDLMTDIVRSGDADVEVVLGRGALADAVADVVIVSAAAATPDQVCELLERRPRTRALSVVSDGERSVLYELRPHAERYGPDELSPDVVRQVVAAPPLPCPQWIPHPE